MEDEPEIVARLRGYVIGCDCDIVARLRGAAISSCDCVKCEAADEIERLRKERDAARRWVCRFDAYARSNNARSCGMSDHFNCPKQIAQERGWDCFKENP